MRDNIVKAKLFFWITSLIGLLFLSCNPKIALAESSSKNNNSQQQLTNLHQEINSVKSKLSQDTKKQATLTEKLKASEKNIGALTVKIDALNTQIDQQQEQISDLENQKKSYENSLTDQQKTLGKLIRANYLLQRQGRLGIYLSGMSADKTNRFLAYHQALDNSMIQAIKNQQETISNLNQVLKQIREKNASLQKTLNEITAQKHKSSQQQKNREQIISALNNSIKSNQQKLNQLNSDQNNLKKIVNTLKPTSINFSQLNFAEQKTKLSWPVKGKVEHLFWTPMAEQQIKWQGDLINAKSGTKVHSIYAGKVIYADWLRGYGLLMIIDHGNGYMSLYGRNNVLYRKAGDLVNTGDVIATVGESGGFKTPALYFEIRHDGTALNPSKWIKEA